jgi:hypothetical protein
MPGLTFDRLRNSPQDLPAIIRRVREPGTGAQRVAVAQGPFRIEVAECEVVCICAFCLRST